MILHKRLTSSQLQTTHRSAFSLTLVRCSHQEPLRIVNIVSTLDDRARCADISTCKCGGSKGQNRLLGSRLEIKLLDKPLVPDQMLIMESPPPSAHERAPVRAYEALACGQRKWEMMDHRHVSSQTGELSRTVIRSEGGDSDYILCVQSWRSWQ